MWSHVLILKHVIACYTPKIKDKTSGERVVEVRHTIVCVKKKFLRHAVTCRKKGYTSVHVF